MPCARCGGLVIENRADFVDDVGQMKLQGTRCVNCGAIDDPVILANRVRPRHFRNDRPRRKVGVHRRDLVAGRKEPQGNQCVSSS